MAVLAVPEFELSQLKVLHKSGLSEKEVEDLRFWVLVPPEYQTITHFQGLMLRIMTIFMPCFMGYIPDIIPQAPLFFLKPHALR